MNVSLAASKKFESTGVEDPPRLVSNGGETKPRRRLRLEAMMLLWEIMARLRGIEMPVLQFIDVSGDRGATDVAASFAHAAAHCVGRTLLVRFQSSQSRGVQQDSDAAIESISLDHRPSKSVDDTFEVVPDSAVPGLCHVYARYDPMQALQMKREFAEIWLDGIALDFRLVIIESRSPERCPATLDLATRCHGSVLVLTAGESSLSQSRAVMRQVQLVGGTLLGAVLRDAPGAPRFPLTL